MSRVLEIPVSLYRGGTSRGLFFLESTLPGSRDARERILLRAFGSPDARQIDGVGGANSQTSKAMIVSRARPGEDADVAMLFAQVGVDRPVVDWGGNCGNMTSAVGLFALDSGLVEPTDPSTIVRIVSRNTGLRVRARIPTRDGRPESEGDYEIPGVPGKAARIDLEWMDPGGSMGKGLLPTGLPCDELELSSGARVRVSVVDAANPVAFCEASSVGLAGTELPVEIESRSEALSLLEEIRCLVAEKMGIAPRELASSTSPGIPKVAVVAKPCSYRTSRGTEEAPESHDIQARMLSMRTAHRSYAVTVAIATAAAARTRGTLAFCPTPEENRIRIAHPYGVMDVGIRMEGSRVASASVGRTARLLMSGSIHLPSTILNGPL